MMSENDEKHDHSELVHLEPDQRPIFDRVKETANVYLEAIESGQAVHIKDLSLEGPEEYDFVEEVFIEALPEATDVLINVSDLAWYLTRLEEFYRSLSASMESVRSASIYADIALAGLVPIFYLLGFILGKKPTLTVGRAAELFYASVLLGIAIAGFLAEGALPILGLILGIVVAGAAVIKLVKLFHDRNEITGKLGKVENELLELQESIKGYQLEGKRCAECLDTEKDLTELNELKNSIKAIYLKSQEAHVSLAKLEKEKNDLDKQNQALGFTEVMDRSVGVFLGSIALVGAVVTLFFPPVGVAILVGSAALGSLYLLGRVGYQWGNKLADWFKARGAQAEVMSDDEDSSKDPLVHESTAIIDKQLEDAPAGHRPIPNDKNKNEIEESSEMRVINKSALKKKSAESNQINTGPDQTQHL